MYYYDITWYSVCMRVYGSFIYWHLYFDCCLTCFNQHEDISVLPIQLTLEIRDPTFSGPTLHEGVCEKVVSWFWFLLLTSPKLPGLVSI